MGHGVRTLFILLACAGALAACANTPPQLAGSWSMIGSALMSNPPTLEIDGPNASCFTGCNRWGGGLVFGANNALRVERAMQTKVACMDAAMAAEQ
jgi:heat shock protein HslJ